MSNVLIGGFHPVDELRSKARRYEIASGNSNAFLKGDVVTLLTAGVADLASAGSTDRILGVVRDVSYWSNGRRIESTYLPASTTYTPTARGSKQASYVYVWDDPEMEFWANVASHANTNTEALVRAAIGANMNLVIGTGSTVYKQSAHTLDGNPITTAGRCQILELVRVPGADFTTANWRAKVRFKQHMYANVDTAI